LPIGIAVELTVKVCQVDDAGAYCGLSLSAALYSVSAFALDLNCKAHELDNLYVVDTSFFCQYWCSESVTDGDCQFDPGGRSPVAEAVSRQPRQYRRAARGFC
jgi:hypothetical protein